ncbi:MAG: UDP-N-acetylmuramoyl-tripeptide--D-alanyl-D-alanine ligase [Planctomycetes bacterium]|nr:UDP-N-acetylmuramoyl-tripeptide--D-alanyl-D-alanine ligase [Planctomycetota bacterium]
MQPVSLDNLLRATGGRAIGFDRNGIAFPAVGIDSRSIRPGELFWAVQGERHDGHDFLGEAFNRGAAACVVEAGKVTAAAGPVVVVKETLKALWDLTRWYRKCQDALVVGVTGSVGKTTTREMIHTVLASQFQGMRSPKNFNNHFGLPLSILEILPEHEFAVLELGASQAGEIRSLAELAAPEIGVMTGIGLSHLEGFGDEQGVLRAKAELIEALPQSGFAVLSGDDPRLQKLAQRACCRVLLVGENPRNDLQATDVEMQQNRIRFRVDSEHFEFSAVGRHHLSAALCAIAIGRELGMPSAAIADGLRSFEAVPGRCRLEQIGPWTVIDDSYNASPTSMKAACDVLKHWNEASGKILVTGDMLELGERSAEFHQELGEMAAASGIDYLAAHGRYAKDVVRGARQAGMDVFRLAECEDFDAMTAVLDCWLEPGAVVLVKGSRAMRMERVVQRLRRQAEKEFPVKNKTPSQQRRACA